MKSFLEDKKDLLFTKKKLIFLIFFTLIVVWLIFAQIINFLKNEGILNPPKGWIQEDELILVNNYFKQGFILTDLTKNCLSKAEIHSQSQNNRITRINFCTTAGRYSWKLSNPNFINDFIWRSKAFKVTPTKITSKRILVVGDSYVWGNGYANMNDLWWRKLQRELVKRGYYDVQVVAVGWQADATRDELQNLKKVIRVYNPDIVVWGYLANDADENIIPYRYYNYKSYDFLFKPVEIIGKVIPGLSLKLGTSLHSSIVDYDKTHITDNLLNWHFSLLQGENFEKYKRTIKEVSSFIKKNNDIPIFFVNLPNVQKEESYDIAYGKLLPLFKSNQIKIYDLRTLLTKKNYPYPRWSNVWKITPSNLLPGTLPSDFYAKQVANILEKGYPKSLPKKFSGHIPKEPLINDWVPMTFRIKQQGNSLTFNYPINKEYFLSMPYGYKYIQLNLSYPKKIKKIEVNGDGLIASRIDIIYENPRDQKVYQLGFKKGGKLSWNNFKSGELVNSIRINANFLPNSSRNITLKIITEDKN